MIVVDVARERVVRTIDLPDGPAGMPQDVKLSPDGRIFYVADMRANGVWEIDAHTLPRARLPRDRRRRARPLPEPRRASSSTSRNRSAGTISVVSFRTRRVVANVAASPAASPDMGGVSADGKVLWLSGRYNSEVYAISTAHRAAARAHPGRRRARTASASGRNPAATRSATPASCADMRSVAAALTTAALALTAYGCSHRAPASAELTAATGSTPTPALPATASRATTRRHPAATSSTPTSPSPTSPASPARCPSDRPSTTADADAVARYIYATAHPSEQ